MDSHIFTKKYYVLLGINIIHLLFSIFVYCNTKVFDLTMHLTLWAYHLNTLQSVLLLICDAYKHITKKETLSNLSKYLRNTFSQIVNPLSYMVGIAFWFFVTLARILDVDTMGKRDVDTKTAVKLIYLHGVCCLIVIADVCLCKREEIKFNKKNFLTLSLITFAYYVVVGISKYIYFVDPYPYLQYLGIIGMIGNCIALYAVIVGCYFLHLFFLRLFNPEKTEIKKKKI